MPTSRAKPLVSWDATRQQQYRVTHAAQVLTFHFVLDASPSMQGAPATNLRTAYAMYLAWLQRHADPMSLAEVGTFASTLTRHPLTALGACTALTDATYDPLDEGGTGLYRAVGQICTSPQGTGQHVLVVFTDGLDTGAGAPEWTVTRVAEILTTLQAHDGWLCVFLGAFPQALDVGRALGFAPGNCLAFPTDDIPAAFERLRQATAQYLIAAPAARKLLATGGVF